LLLGLKEKNVLKPARITEFPTPESSPAPKPIPQTVPIPAPAPKVTPWKMLYPTPIPKKGPQQLCHSLTTLIKSKKLSYQPKPKLQPIPPEIFTFGGLGCA